MGKKGIKFELRFFIIVFGLLIATSCCLAADIDISIKNVATASKIYLKQKTSIEITVSNNSNVDLDGCLLNVEATDGSKASQWLLLKKNTSQKLLINWIPQSEGKIEFKAAIALPKDVQDKDKTNNQVTKTIEVLSQ